MPLDVLGCTRATLTDASSISRLVGMDPWPIGLGNLFKIRRAGDR